MLYLLLIDLGNKSVVAFKGYALDTHFLHSHIHKYPEDDIQQVTGYGDMDYNSLWYIRKFDFEDSKENERIIKTGDLVTIHHLKYFFV